MRHAIPIHPWSGAEARAYAPLRLSSVHTRSGHACRVNKTFLLMRIERPDKGPAVSGAAGIRSEIIAFLQIVDVIDCVERSSAAIVIVEGVHESNLPQFAFGIVRIRFHDRPSIFIDIDRSLGIGVSLTLLQRRFDNPDAVRLPADRVRVQMLLAKRAGPATSTDTCRSYRE